MSEARRRARAVASPVERGGHEGRHHRGVGVAGGLQRAEHVEEPEHQDGDPERLGVGQRVGLGRQLAGRVGLTGAAGPGPRRRATWCWRRRPKTKMPPPPAGPPPAVPPRARRGCPWRSLVGGLGVLERARHRSPRRQVDHRTRRPPPVAPGASASRIEPSTSSTPATPARLSALPRGEVVEHHHRARPGRAGQLPAQVGADEARPAGDEHVAVTGGPVSGPVTVRPSPGAPDGAGARGGDTVREARRWVRRFGSGCRARNGRSLVPRRSRRRRDR